MRLRMWGVLAGVLLLLPIGAELRADGYGGRPAPPQQPPVQPPTRPGELPKVPQHHPLPRLLPPIPPGALGSDPTWPDHGGLEDPDDRPDPLDGRSTAPTPPPGFPPDDGGLGEDPPGFIDSVLGLFGFGPDGDGSGRGDAPYPGGVPDGFGDLPEPAGGEPPSDPPEDPVERLPRNPDGQPVVDLPLGVEPGAPPAAPGR